MTGKERVRLTLNRQRTDRIACDFWSQAQVAAELREYLKMRDHLKLLDYLGVDLRYVFPRYTGEKCLCFPDGSTEDIWGVRRDGRYNEVCFAPLSGAETVKDVEKFTWPDASWYDYQGLLDSISACQNYAIVLSAERTNRPSVLHQGIYLCGMEKIMAELVWNSALVEAIFEQVSNFYLEVLRRSLEVAGNLIDIVLVGDDLGTQESLLVSPEILRRLVFPYLKRYFSLIHHYGAKVMFHSCGAIRPIIPDLIEAGVDILNPIQVRAKGMVPTELSKEFGRFLCFHGGIDIQKTLPFGTPEDVRREVKQRLEEFAGSGYIVCSTHNFQKSTPLENILAMYQAAGTLKQ